MNQRSATADSIRTSLSCRTGDGAGCQGCIRVVRAVWRAPFAAAFPPHQTFDNDTAVGFGQSCCQHVQVVGTDIN